MTSSNVLYDLPTPTYIPLPNPQLLHEKTVYPAPIQPNALRRDQLEEHLAQLAEYDRSHLLVLTPDEEKPQLVQELERSYPTMHFISWIDLIQLMTNEGPDGGNNPVGTFMFNDFIAFMERQHQKMTLFTGFRFIEGYEKDLATHYVKRVSKEITPEMQSFYPKCVNTRPKMVPYADVEGLKSNEALNLILRCFKGLKSIYELVTVD